MEDVIGKLKAYEDHEDPLIKNISRELLVLVDGLDREDLTKEQAKELTEDILELQKIRQMKETLERKTMLLQTVNAIRYVVEGVLL